MSKQEKTEELAAKIIASKKYRFIYEKTIERIVSVCAKKYSQKKTVEKKARNLLHQIWAAYYTPRPDFEKLLNRLKAEIAAGKEKKESVLEILRVQSSTAERLPILENFYSRIFSLTGPVESIIDHGCGLNSLTFFWMDLAKSASYQAFDIDKEQIEFLNSVFALFGEKQVKIGLADILADKFDWAEMVFLLKLLPCLEKQEKGVSQRTLESAKAKYLVVSYPIKSLSGRQKGMPDFYSQQFHDLVKAKPWQVEKLLFATELVFVVKK